MIEQLEITTFLALAGHNTGGEQVGFHLSVAALFFTVFALERFDDIGLSAVLAVVVFLTVLEDLCFFAFGAFGDDFVSEVFLGGEAEGVVGVAYDEGDCGVLHYY